MITSCSNYSISSTQQININRTIDSALTTLCDPLPLPATIEKTAHAKWIRAVIIQYQECRAKHRSLVELMQRSDLTPRNH